MLPANPEHLNGPGIPLAHVQQDRGALTGILFGIFVFSQLFGIKLFGVLDITVMASVAAALLLQGTGFDRRFAPFLAGLGLFYSYTLLSVMLSPEPDYHVLARYTRLVVSALLLALIISRWQMNIERVFKAVSLCIVVHAVAILLQMAFPELKNLMGPVVGFVKESHAIRAFGLLGGYDLAALYLCIGMLTSCFLYNREQRLRYVFYLVLMFLAGLFTGRTFMVIGSFELLLGFAVIVWYSSLPRKILFTSVAAGLLGAFVIVFAPLIIQSFNLADHQAEMVLLGQDVSQKGYYNDSLAVLKNQIYLPENGINLLFGGLPSPLVDFGYSRLVYTHGLIGSMLILGLHVLLAWHVWRVEVWGSGGNAVQWVLLVVLALMLVFNAKMIMIGTRGISEMFLLIMYSGIASGKPR